MSVPVPAACDVSHWSCDGAAGASSDDFLEEEERFAVRSLRDHIQRIVDRRSPHGKVHSLHGVLCLVIVALVCRGVGGLSEVVAFAQGQGARRRYNGPDRRKKILRDRREKPQAAPWLLDIGLHWRDEVTVPCVGQLITILGTVTAGDVCEAMSGWVSDLLARAQTRRLVVSIDGKAMRAGGDRRVLSAFVHDLYQTVFHLEVKREKKNELSTLRDALDELLDRYQGLWLLVGDALFADQSLCKMLDGRKRHWLFQIKENQPALLEKMRVVFSPLVRKRKPDAVSEPEKRGTMWSGASCGWPTGPVRG